MGPIEPDWRSRIDKRFTSLRGFAALTVMLAHYQYIGFLPVAPVFKYSGQCGLMVFFFLSSFLLCHSLASDPSWKTRLHLSLIAYAINRGFRIFPLLLAVLALTCWNRSSFFPSSVSYWEALRQSLTLGRAPSVLWTIPVELAFYVYLPIVLALTALAVRPRLGAALVGSVYLAWCVAIAAARHNGVPASLWMTLGFHHYANSFVGGVLFYTLLANDRIRFPRSGACIAWIAPLVFLCAYPFFNFTLFRGDPSMTDLSRPEAWQSYYDAVFPFAPLVVGGVIYALLHPSDSALSRILRARLLRRTGELSFGVYLVHIPMLMAFESRFGYGQWQFLASIAATFAAAAALSVLIEKPGMAFGRDLGQWLLADAGRKRAEGSLPEREGELLTG
jgi:peptidoglycan/LPS O-acetylase OafA/YrhL